MKVMRYVSVFLAINITICILAYQNDSLNVYRTLQGMRLCVMHYEESPDVYYIQIW